MVVDYSKWVSSTPDIRAIRTTPRLTSFQDALELSDDSDIEVHPNVDKKSFIRAKQAQIHQERDRRRHQIKTLKYERIINDGLSERMGRLLTALKSHKSEETTNSDALVFQSMMESMAEAGEDRPPPPPEGVHEHVKEKPSYPQMMASLIDEVKKEVDASNASDRLSAFISGLESHKGRVDSLQKELLAKLAELEKEDKRHITSDDIHEGFNYSNVRQSDPTPSKPAPASASSSTPTATPELLNPSRPTPSRADTGQSSGADADIEDGPAVDDDSVEASPLGKAFAKIPSTDYSSLLQYLLAHPQILQEKETDGLLVEAFNSALDNKPKHAKQCVHAALLIQYCRQLGGRDGVQLFFKRITNKEHQAHKLFVDDVDSTWRRISTRVGEILKEREDNPQGAEGVEQIQLHAVDPNTTINIRVPAAEPTSDDPQEAEAEKAARAIFENFPPGLQRALESGKLDEVNKVLAKMSVEEAEEIVEKLGDGGMLSLEQGVIDATTDEGRMAMKQIEKTGKMPVQE
jgi:cell division cycle protein 37